MSRAQRDWLKRQDERAARFAPPAPALGLDDYVQILEEAADNWGAVLS